MSDLPVLRDTIESIFQAKCRALVAIGAMQRLDKEISSIFEDIHGYSPCHPDYRFDNHMDKREEKYVDRTCWRYLVGLFFLERYMLCTDYERMKKEIENFETPVFTIENARAWIEGLKDLINDNVRMLVKQVYRTIIDGHYNTGAGCNAQKKKRNNAGVDQMFILRTGDYSSLFGYWSSRPTETDDLEKVCYLLDGKTVPDVTAKMTMKQTQNGHYECEYFTIDVRKNGNTQYKLAPAIRDKLNRYGPEGATIGENIKIKIFQDRWAS